ncbi:hypothetical protein Bca4012_047562 [Brassica carinata]
MVDGWCKEGEIELAMSCVARMYEDEKDPDVVTYTSLIHGLCASGRPSEVISRWNKMKGRGCCPNEITFMALIQGLCKCGWTSEALVYFREMEEKEMEPDSGVYVSLVSSFLLSGNISEGFGIFREMVCKGRFPVLVDRNYMVAVDAADKVYLLRLVANDLGQALVLKPIRSYLLVANLGLMSWTHLLLTSPGGVTHCSVFPFEDDIQDMNPGMHRGISQLYKAVKATQIHCLAHDKTYFDSKKIYAALHLVGTTIDLIV